METSRPKPELVTPLLWALLYFISGYVSHWLNGPVHFTGYIWLPAGVTVAAFMLRPVHRWLPVCAAFLVAQLALNGIEGVSLFHALLFTLDEVGPAALAVWLMRRIRFSLEGLYFLRSVVFSGVIAGSLGALGGGAWYAWLNGASFWDVWSVWAASDFVGIVLVAPILASWSRFRVHRSGDHARFDIVFGIVLFMSLAVISWFIFDGDSIEKFGLGFGFSMTYIPLFLTVAVTVLLGGRSGSLSVLILAIIVILKTAQHNGPFAMLSGRQGDSLLEAQLFLAVASLLVLTVSTLKTTRELVHVRAAALQNNMELALAGAEQLAYVFDPTTGQIAWSGDVQLVFGLGIDPTMLANVPQVLERLHPDDRETLRNRWSAEAASADRDPVSLRIALRQGEQCTVLDRGAPLMDSNVDVTVIAGVWQIEHPYANV